MRNSEFGMKAQGENVQRESVPEYLSPWEPEESAEG